MSKNITVLLNEPSFSYDVRSLLRAFFPYAEVVFKEKAETAAVNSRLKLIFSGWPYGGCVYVCWQDERTEVFSAYGLDRPAVKNKIKRILYDTISKSTGISLPWGTLTGIRPVRLAIQRVRKGLLRDEVLRYMYKEYRVSEAKASLSYEIACREEKIIKSFDNDRGYCLYVGIPFCPSICLYCSFSSYPIERYKDRTGDYLAVLFSEIDFVAESLKERPLSAIYIGGGTPSSLSAGELFGLLHKLSDSFELSGLKEWTIEAGRPDSITKEKLSAIRAYGDLRISINPQTFNQKTLELIGRRHSTEDVKRAFLMAREAGFSNINMDLIVGLSGEGEKEVANTLRETELLHPDNLTVHSLALKRASRLSEEWELYGEDSFFQSEHIMQMVYESAERMGMSPYYLYRQKDIAGNLENTGFAPPGKEGIYNILIMEEVQDIIACGAGAITKRVGRMNLPEASLDEGRPLKTERAANVKDVGEYILRIEEMLERKKKLLNV